MDDQIQDINAKLKHLATCFPGQAFQLFKAYQLRNISQVMGCDMALFCIMSREMQLKFPENVK